MKKQFKYLLAAAMMLFAYGVEAKTLSFGLKGGVTLSSLSLDSNVKETFGSDNRAGFFIGPMIGIKLPLGFGLDGAVMYSQNKVKYSDDYGTVSDIQRMIEIPINLKWSIGFKDIIGVYATAGPDFMFNFGKMGDIADHLSSVSNMAVSADTKEFTVGISLGAGIVLVSHLQIGFNYIFPLQDSYKFSAEGYGEVLTAKDKRWQISAAYLF